MTVDVAGAVAVMVEIPGTLEIPGALCEIVLVDCKSPCREGEDGSPWSSGEVVPVDSDTAVPMELYMDLINAGERARARGQHHVERGRRSTSKPHLIRTAPTRTASQTRLSQEGLPGVVLQQQDATPSPRPCPIGDGGGRETEAETAAHDDEDSPAQELHLEVLPDAPSVRPPRSGVSAARSEVGLDVGHEPFARKGRSWYRSPSLPYQRTISGGTCNRTPRQNKLPPLSSKGAVQHITGLLGGMLNASTSLLLGTQDPGEFV